MANYTQLLKLISNNIKANGNQEITGQLLGGILHIMVATLGEGYQFMGIATPDTNPGTPDGNVFYIAIEPGTYRNFGVIVLNGSIGIISNTSYDWKVKLINTYYEIDVDTLMQDSPSSDDIDEAIGSFTYLRRAITVGVPILGKSASGGNSTVAIAQVKQLSNTEVRVVMLNTGTVDGSNELVPIIKKITNSAGRLSLSTEAPTSFVGPLSSLNTNDKGSVVKAINEVNTGLKSVIKPYVVDLTSLLAAQDSESISTAIGGIDNLNGTVQKNQVIFGTLANGTVAVGIRVLGNQTTLTYFVDSVVGLTVNEVIITNTSGTLSKSVTTHSVLTKNMVINSLESDETTLPLSAAQGNALKEDVKTNSYMQYLHKVYEEYGAVYNANTGYWELNGLTDLTEEDMWDIYLWCIGLQNMPDLNMHFAYSPIRTTLKFNFVGNYLQTTGTSLNQMCINAKELEVFNISKGTIQIILNTASTTVYNCFAGCEKLRRIENVLSVRYNTQTIFINAFSGCAKLSYIKIRDLKQIVSFKDSPLLSYESIKYLVDNAANTKAITVTVHPTTYSYLTGTVQPTEEVGGTTEEWQALVTTAQGKQISFAVPEETQSEVTE